MRGSVLEYISSLLLSVSRIHFLIHHYLPTHSFSSTFSFSFIFPNFPILPHSPSAHTLTANAARLPARSNCSGCNRLQSFFSVEFKSPFFLQLQILLQRFPAKCPRQMRTHSLSLSRLLAQMAAFLQHARRQLEKSPRRCKCSRPVHSTDGNADLCAAGWAFFCAGLSKQCSFTRTAVQDNFHCLGLQCY